MDTDIEAGLETVLYSSPQRINLSAEMHTSAWGFTKLKRQILINGTEIVKDLSTKSA